MKEHTVGECWTNNISRALEVIFKFHKEESDWLSNYGEKRIALWILFPRIGWLPH